MAARWYCVQAANARGWIDLISLASLKLKEANDWAKEFAELRQVITRVIRKPHGWGPHPEVSPEPEDYMSLSRMGFATLEMGSAETPGSRMLRPSESDQAEALPEAGVPASRKHEKARRRRPKTCFERVAGKEWI